MKDLLDRLRKAGVHSLLAQFTDLAGVAKGKLVPLTHLDELLAHGVGFAGPSIVGTGLPRVGPRSEYYARGNASTATVLPWMPGVARIVCDGFVDDQPFEACPRQVLKRAAAHLAERGWQLRSGIEPEFFLLRRDGEQWLPADAADRLDKPSYDLKSLARQGEYLHALHAVLAQCGLDVLQLDHEDAHGQYEVNFGFDDALASADHVMLFKLAAHALAEARGLQFSMMPKPFADQAGSGMHMHVSLWGGGSARHPDHARNLFVPHRADGSADLEATLSPLGAQFLAGVLAHGAALTALAAPTVNSYKRLRSGSTRSGTTWSPVWLAHGPNNRTTAVRTLHGRFEWRVPDSAANPYLATAALIAAGLDGIDRRLELPPECLDDLYDLPAAELRSRGYARLPASLGAALDALQADDVIRTALGDALVEQFVRLKREEIDAYEMQISGWELQRYAGAF
jgi:glutamine synthetase